MDYLQNTNPGAGIVAQGKLPFPKLTSHIWSAWLKFQLLHSQSSFLPMCLRRQQPMAAGTESLSPEQGTWLEFLAPDFSLD